MSGSRSHCFTCGHGLCYPASDLINSNWPSQGLIQLPQLQFSSDTTYNHLAWQLIFEQ